MASRAVRTTLSVPSRVVAGEPFAVTVGLRTTEWPEAAPPEGLTVQVVADGFRLTGDRASSWRRRVTVGPTGDRAQVTYDVIAEQPPGVEANRRVDVLLGMRGSTIGRESAELVVEPGAELA